VLAEQDKSREGESVLVSFCRKQKHRREEDSFSFFSSSFFFFFFFLSREIQLRRREGLKLYSFFLGCCVISAECYTFKPLNLHMLSS
jgi:hypothetical protein